MDFLKELNPQQYEAVVHTEGPVVVFAGAGTGKTRVITSRIAYLVREKKIPPSRILAITFTNKAAGEMRERVAAMVGQSAVASRPGSGFGGGAWVSTFHSFCARVLKTDAASFGVRPDFVIYDEDDQRRTVKDILKELRLAEDKSYRPSAVAEKINRLKDSLIDAESYALNSLNPSDAHRRIFSEIYSMYAKKLEVASALDFGDLILKVVERFRGDAALLERYQKRFDYVLVDEYQDTNAAQYYLTKYLSAGHSNVCVVGDDDQSIYSWRGADRKNISSFRSDHPSAKVVKLEQNYRSTPQILAAAVSVISNNLDRHPKSLWTRIAGGQDVAWRECDSDLEEAQAVASEIRRLVDAENIAPEKIAILYRMNSQSRLFEDALLGEGIPYRLVGSVKFYERQEVKNLIAYLRVIQNPDDEVSLKRIINVPRRGIGAVTLDKLISHARAHNLTLFQTMRISDTFGGLSAKAASRVGEFADRIIKWQSESKHLTPAALTKSIAECSGYLAELQRENTPESLNRAANIKELVSAVAEYEELHEDPTIAGWLDDIALSSSADFSEGAADGAVLTTVHLAKGLEFDAVFVVGMEESVFPMASAFRDPSEIEEERRLCYVAFTRARRRLYASGSRFKVIYGKPTRLTPSRFVSEAFASAQKPAAGAIDESAAPPAAAGGVPASGRWHTGAVVRHKTFGEGVIIAVAAVDDDTKLTVRFHDGKLRKFYARYAFFETIADTPY